MLLQELEKQIGTEIEVLRKKINKKKELIKIINTSEIPVSVLKEGVKAESPEKLQGTDFYSMNMNREGETIIVEYV